MSSAKRLHHSCPSAGDATTLENIGKSNGGTLSIKKHNKARTEYLFYQRVLTLIPAWISIHMSCKVWQEITYPFPNFNGCTWRHQAIT